MSQAGKLKVRVAIDPPTPDETVSSVLDRAATFWEVERWVFLEGLGLTTPDWDDPSQPALHALAEATGFAVSVLQALVIAPSPGNLPMEGRTAYCPSCWKDDMAKGRAPYFRRTWAHAAAIACSLHGTPLYEWEVDGRGERRPPPTHEARRGTHDRWHGDLAHAQTAQEHGDLHRLATFAQTAHAALEGETAWPKGWRGDRAAGLALVRLLTTNPAPFPDRLAMDRLLPVAADWRRFAVHRRASPSTSPEAYGTWMGLADPAIRRTLWWLLARTLVVGWPPLPLRGTAYVCIGGDAWWIKAIGPVVSGYAQQAYCDLGVSLGLLVPGHSLELFAA